MRHMLDKVLGYLLGSYERRVAPGGVSNDPIRTHYTATTKMAISRLVRSTRDGNSGLFEYERATCFYQQGKAKDFSHRQQASTRLSSKGIGRKYNRVISN